MLRLIAATISVLVMLWTSLAQAAQCGGFTDVDDANPLTAPFCENVEWIKNRGITLGCTSATLFCPFDNVSRLQMAAFLNRLGNVTFQQGGNAFNAPAVLGTTDLGSVQLIVNGTRALMMMPGVTPSIVGGHPANNATNCLGCLPTPARPHGVTVSGGGNLMTPNRVTDSYGVVGGGLGNHAGNDDADPNDVVAATVAGGISNVASATASTVGGGSNNEASGAYATVLGGHTNRATAFGSIVVGGANNEATGAYSFAAGINATANFDGCFVWSDSAGFSQPCTAQDQFVVRATGGVKFVTAVNGSGAATAGVELLAGDSSWNPISDRAAKTNWRDVDGREVLDKLASIPIGEWNYRAQSDGIRHMGPSAQDFRAAFGLGHGDKTIATVDADGVALAAIQGLNAKLEDRLAAKDAEIAALRTELAEIRELVQGARLAPR